MVTTETICGAAPGAAWQTAEVPSDGFSTVAAAGPAPTGREAEVLALVRAHLSNAEIAAQLHISIRTVETHVSALLRKLGAADRRELARLPGGGGDERPAVPGAGPPLPVALTSFVGREAEHAELEAALAGHRLVSVVGPGGAGKTRLALEVARRLAGGFADGAVFVDLVKVSEPEMVAVAAAEAFGLSERAGVDREEGLLAALAGRRSLVVLDNCEHVVERVRALVERLLAAAPGLTVLATTRTRLLLPFEQVFPLTGLSFDGGEGGGRGGGGDAAQLFLARLASAGAGEAGERSRESVELICRRLDGNALAIELAAARVPALGIDGMAAVLDERLAFLAVPAGSGHRHSSLRAAIDWSYDLLDAEARRALRAAALFAAPFEAAALAMVLGVERVTALAPLARLVEASLADAQPGSPTRYRLLETIRQYGVEQAEEAGELGVLRAAHAGWCRAGLERLLRTAPGDDGWRSDVDHLVDDARAAVAWNGGADGLAERLADVLFQRGWPGEAQQRYEQAAAATAAPGERRRLLRLASGAAAARNVGGDAVELLCRAADEIVATDPQAAAEDLAAAAMFRNRAAGIIAAPITEEGTRALLDRSRELSGGAAGAVATIAVAEIFAPGAGARSRQATEDALALATASGSALLVSAALDGLTSNGLLSGDVDVACAAASRRLAVLGELPVDAAVAFELYDACHMACLAETAAGRLEQVRATADRLSRLPYLREARHVSLSHCLEIDALSGRLDRVVANAELFERDWVRAGRPVASNLASAAGSVALAFGLLDDPAEQSRWEGIAIDLTPPDRRDPERRHAWPLLFGALVALHRGQLGEAAEQLSFDPDDRDSWCGLCHMWLPWYAAAQAEAAVLAGSADVVQRVARAKATTGHNEPASLLVARAEALAAGRSDLLAAVAAQLDALGCPYQADRTRLLTERSAAAAPE